MSVSFSRCESSRGFYVDRVSSKLVQFPGTVEFQFIKGRVKAIFKCDEDLRTQLGQDKAKKENGFPRSSFAYEVYTGDSPFSEAAFRSFFAGQFRETNDSRRYSYVLRNGRVGIE